MKFKGTLIKPLDQQHDTDEFYIDPKGVSFEDKDMPLWANFDYSVPKSVLGHGRVVVQEDGGLGFEGELNESGEAFVGRQLAVGVRVAEGERDSHPNMVRVSELMAVSLTEHHQDPDQPPIEILDEAQAEAEA